MKHNITHRTRKTSKKNQSKKNPVAGKIKKKSKSKTKNKTRSSTKKSPLKIFATKQISDTDIKQKEGEFFPVDHYQIFIDDDADVYYIDNGTEKLLCSFRKNVIPKQLCQDAFQSLYKYAQRWHTNRGAAAGIIDSKKVPPHVGRLTQRDKFRAYYYSKVDGKFHKDHISNLSQSNIIGFYDRPDRNLGKNAPPCRETKFNKDYPDKWQTVQPFLKHIGKLFKKLVPYKYDLQYKRASKTPQYQIKGTPFSTATINYNWQTGLHRDKGDFIDGFGNLVILEKGQYEGGYIGFPQYGVSINVRQGDFLAMDVHQWHTNSDILLKSPNAARLSVVCYLRHKMLRCQST
jgi:hypothetical protein